MPDKKPISRSVALSCSCIHTFHPHASIRINSKKKPISRSIALSCSCIHTFHPYAFVSPHLHTHLFPSSCFVVHAHLFCSVQACSQLHLGREVQLIAICVCCVHVSNHISACIHRCQSILQFLSDVAVVCKVCVFCGGKQVHPCVSCINYVSIF